MTIGVEVDFELGRVHAIPVPVTSTDLLLISGPATLVGYSIRDASGDAAQAKSGAVTSPTTGQAIVSLTGLPAGTYDITWTVGLAGTLAAGDANNFELKSSGGLGVASVNPGVAGDYPQAAVRATIGASGSFQVVAFLTGTVGADYSADIAIVPVEAGNAVVEIQDGDNPLAEIGVDASGVESQWYGDSGFACRNQMLLHVVNGIVTGAVYAKYQC